MTFGLDQSIIDTLTTIFEQYLNVDKAILFGSRAKGNYRPDSDIDIALKGQDITTDDIIKVSVEIEDQGITQAVDLLAYDTISEPALKEHIDRVGVEFYSRWKEYKTSELIRLNILSIGDGYRAKNTELSATIDTGIPFARVGNINEGFNFNNADYYPLNKLSKVGNKVSRIGDTVFTSKGTVGRFAFVNEETPSFVYSPQLCFWRSLDCDFILPQFLYYWMQSNEFSNQSDAVKGQTDMADYVNLKDQRNMKLTLPPLQDQIAIASILSGLDDKIDLLQRQNKTLEELAETLFRQWFVEEAEESWEEKELGEILTITSSKRIFYSEYVSFGVPFYRSKEIIELRNTGSTDSELYISEERFNEINNRFGSPKEGDILMTSVGTLGVAYRVNGTSNFYFKDGNLTWFKDFKEIPSSIIYMWIISRIGQEEIASRKIGSTQEALTIEGLKSISFKIPPKEKVSIYKLEFDGFLEKIKSNQTQIRSLTQTRDTLLPKLMSGEVRVL